MFNYKQNRPRLYLKLLTGFMLLLASIHPARAVDSVANPDKIAVGLGRPLTESLNGEWKFQRDPDEQGEKENWFKGGKITERSVKVPLPWQLADEELLQYRGTAWYERHFNLPEKFNNKRVTLNFYGVDDEAKVWVNGKLAGEHIGAQPPFLLDITELVKPGKNTVTIKVNDPLAGKSYFMDTHSLIGVSGLWRDVWIEATSPVFISDLFMLPDIDKSHVTAKAKVYLPVMEGKWSGRLDVTIQGPDGEKIMSSMESSHDENIEPAFRPFELTIGIQNAKLWDIDNPNLYQVEAKLFDERGDFVDAVTTDFGMRKLSTSNGRIYLNNKPIYIVGGGLDPGPFGGAVDVDWHKPGPYAYPSDEEIQSDLKKAKSLGVNFVRVPLRPAHPRTLYWADRMGLLVMQGGPWTPTEGIQGDEGYEEYKKSWSKIVLRDRNHPSMALWELFNESMGIRAQKFKVLAGGLYDHVKALDPTRFILDNAGGGYLNELNYINNHGKTDIEDVHTYPGFPTFFAEGGEHRYPDTAREEFLRQRWREHPLLITEFAPSPYVYNVDKILKEWGGKKPWWFDAKQVKSAMPAQWDLNGYDERFHKWGMDKIYGDFTKYTEASDWYYFWGTKYATELMRMNPELSGWVAWLFDGAPHPVGHIDFFKDIKIYGDELAKIWQQDLLIIDDTERNYWESESVYANVHFSHFSQNEVKDAKIKWELEGSDIKGELAGISMQPGEARLLGQISFRLPDMKESSYKKITARLVNSEGRTLAENYERIQVYPLKERKPALPQVAVYGRQYDRFKVETNRYEVLGYEPVPFDDKAPLVVVEIDGFDEKIINYLKNGGTVVYLLCDRPDYWERRTQPKVLPFEKYLVMNNLALGGKFQGGHSDTFYARKGLGIFDALPYENPYTWAFAEVWPRRVLAGLKAEYNGDVLAGAHGNLFRSVPRDSEAKRYWTEVSATLAQFRCGKGRLIISTFNLIKPMLEDPAAAIILNNLIKYAAGDFQPKAEFALDDRTPVEKRIGELKEL